VVQLEAELRESRAAEAAALDQAADADAERKATARHARVSKRAAAAATAAADDERAAREAAEVALEEARREAAWAGAYTRSLQSST